MTVNLTVIPKVGYVNDQFNVHWEITVPTSGRYKLALYLNGSWITDVPDKQGIFMKSGETREGDVKIRTTKIGDNEVKAVLMEYIPTGLVGNWRGVEAKTVTFTATTTVGGECTKEEFRNTMVNRYKESKQLIGWYDSYSPILDVTEMVRKVYPEVTRARLTIYGSDLSKIGVIGPYDTEPPEREAVDIVNGWLMETEYQRIRCSRNGKYYWVSFPCKLETEGETPPTPTTPPTPPAPPEKGIPWYVWLLLLMLGAAFLLRQRSE